MEDNDMELVIPFRETTKDHSISNKMDEQPPMLRNGSHHRFRHRRFAKPDEPITPTEENV